MMNMFRDKCSTCEHIVYQKGCNMQHETCYDHCDGSPHSSMLSLQILFHVYGQCLYTSNMHVTYAMHFSRKEITEVSIIALSWKNKNIICCGPS